MDVERAPAAPAQAVGASSDKENSESFAFLRDGRRGAALPHSTSTATCSGSWMPLTGDKALWKRVQS